MSYILFVGDRQGAETVHQSLSALVPDARVLSASSLGAQAPDRWDAMVIDAFSPDMARRAPDIAKSAGNGAMPWIALARDEETALAALDAGARAVVPSRHWRHLALTLRNVLDEMARDKALRRMRMDLLMFRALVENSREAIAVSDAEGHLVFVNRAHERLFKRSLDEARRCTWRDYYPPETLEKFEMETIPALSRGEGWEGEIEVYDGEGRRFPIWERADTVRDNDGRTRYVFALMHDISDRRDMEAALRQQAVFLQTIIDAVPLPIFVKDRESRFVECNRADEEFLGLPRERIIGRGTEIIPGTEQAMHRRMDEMLLASPGVCVYEVQMPRGDGALRDLVVRKASWLDGEGHIGGVVGVLLDVTERKGVEAALQASEAHLKALFDHVPFDLWMMGPEGRYVMQNEVSRRHRGSFVGRSPEEVAPDPLSLMQWKDNNARAFAGERVFGEMSYDEGGVRRTYLNIVGPVQDRERILGIVGINIDVTDRHRTEQELAVSEERFRLAARHTGHLVYDFDVPSGRIVWMGALEALLGEKGEQFDGLDFSGWTKRIHGDDVERVMGEFAEALREKRSYRLNYRFRRSDGQWLDMQDSGGFVLDRDGNVLRAVGIMVDVSEQKKSEEALRRLVEKNSVLLREVHHRTKNNMQVIASLLSMQARMVGDERLARVLREEQNRIRAMALAQEEIYRSEDLASLDAARYIRRVAEGIFSVYAAANREVHLLTDLDHARLALPQAIPLGLILNELISNGLKHAFPRERLAALEGRGEVRVATGARQGYFVLEVSDNGVGLPTAFDATGRDTLGMQIVTTLVKQLDGTLEIETDDGAIFRILFPVAEVT